MVSRLELGLAALGRPGYINVGHGFDLAGRTEVAGLEQHAHTLLDAAHEGGSATFDAGRTYGQAETFLSSWLERRGLAAGAVTVGSKYTYTAGWRVDAVRHEVKDLSLATLRRQVAESRDLLGPPPPRVPDRAATSLRCWRSRSAAGSRRMRSPSAQPSPNHGRTSS